jgi:prolyl-tRNA editing enzyme YbaK/EbsC (Cys-tRNA(Pro) deacylase)
VRPAHELRDAVSAAVSHPAVRDALSSLGIDYEVVPCDPALADTAAFCAAYGFDPEDAANCIVVASRRPAGQHLVALVLATTRLDVNGRCCELMGVRRASFAPLEQTAELTGMEIGGVTPFGLPASMQPVRVDGAVLRRARVVVGGGDRTAKLVVDPAVFARPPLFEVVDGLAAPAGERQAEP